MFANRSNLVDREDPFVEIVARKVVEIAGKGEHDPGRICELVLLVLKQSGGEGRAVSQLSCNQSAAYVRRERGWIVRVRADLLQAADDVKSGARAGWATLHLTYLPLPVG